MTPERKDALRALAAMWDDRWKRNPSSAITDAQAAANALTEVLDALDKAEAGILRMHDDRWKQ